MGRAYRTVLKLYPADYRAMFGVEMIHTFEEVSEDRGLRVLPELMGLLAGAGAEWIAKLTTDATVRGRALPDVRMMRPPGIPREVWFRG